MRDLQALTPMDISNKKRILVVEDDPTISEMLQGIIEEWGGYQAIVATDGSQALSLLNSAKPDLLLVDYHLPGMNGLDLYHRLHAECAWAAVPVLFLSAIASETIFEQEHLAFIRKPFELEDLLLKIEALLTG